MSILNRTVFYDNTGGVVRFWDWALTNTTLGLMAEPFRVDSRFTPTTPYIEFDPTDEISRIDEIRAMSIDRANLHLSGGSHALNGGYQIPRVGR